MFIIQNIRYRKANIVDLNEIANLVTDLLGTCNIDRNDKELKTKQEIIIENIKEIKRDICNYYVCETDNKVIGACGISNIKTKNNYGIDLGKYREILYLAIKNEYQRKGIGTELMHLCCDNVKDKIIYEAWGDKEYVNSKFLLEKLDFKLLKDLGDYYYRDNGYCSYCINRNNNCISCKAQIWIRN